MSHRTVCRWVAKFSAGQQQLKDVARQGRPATKTTKGHIENDSPFTVRQLGRMTNLSLAIVHAILKKRLKVRKVNARRVPNLLTDEHKKARVTMAKTNLKMYPKYSKKAFDNIVTGDETWVYYFELKWKVANRIWATKNSRHLSIAKRVRTVKKVLYAIFSLIRVQLFKSCCRQAERSQAPSIKELF